MSLIYITGISGSGKSSVLKELKSRGYEAHGVDEDVYANWIHRKTGKVGHFPHPPKPDFDFHKWYKQYEWELDADKVHALKKEADKDSKTIFLCGIASGEDKAWHNFDKVFALTVGADTIKQRIRDRTDNNFGKSPEELEKILEWHSTHEDDYRRFGAILIDAHQPVDKVVDEIVRKVN